MQSHLYGRDQDIFESIEDGVITGEDGVDAVVIFIHKRDPLTIVSTVPAELVRFISTDPKMMTSTRNR